MTDNEIVKCQREGYDEAPFFYVEPEGDTPYAVCWFGDPERLRKAALSILRRWPAELEVHFEAPVHPQPEDHVYDLFGDVTRDNLERALREQPTVAFRDGGVRIRVWRKDREDCIGLDEHGLLFYWGEPDRARKVLSAFGVEERHAPLIQDEEHWHSDPDGAENARTEFVGALEI